DRLPDRAPRDDDHLYPRLLVVDRARSDLSQVLVVLADGPDMVQRLLVALAGEDLPDLGRSLSGPVAHATIPRLRMRARASSRIRLRVQTGSHTTSMRTMSTSGSRSSRSRMSSSMNSIAGQPMAVNVSWRSTACSTSLYAIVTMRPKPTTETGISGSSTSRRAVHSRASTS